MYTSMVCLALTTLAGALPQAKEPHWQSNYAEAYRKGKTEKKPLAVFVGSGKQGYDKVAEEGKLSKRMREILCENYICVYVDTTRETGKEWAQAFRLGTGIVLSDRLGEAQAFRHDGSLPSTTLATYLERFADPDVVVRETIRHGVPRTSYYPSEGNITLSGFGRATGSC